MTKQLSVKKQKALTSALIYCHAIPPTPNAQYDSPTAYLHLLLFMAQIYWCFTLGRGSYAHKEGFLFGSF